jgi:hypothetical protein
MTETIDAIQDRVNPRNIVNRAKATIKDSTMERMRSAAHSMGTSTGYVMARTERARSQMMRVARRNPAIAAAVGFAAMYVLVRALRGKRRPEYLQNQAR